MLDRLDVPGPAEHAGRCANAMRRAEVAIARALRSQVPGAGVMILDEATRALPARELARLHQLLRRVVAEGTSILMVSHNLEEVLGSPTRSRSCATARSRPPACPSPASPSTTSHATCSAGRSAP